MSWSIPADKALSVTVDMSVISGTGFTFGRWVKKASGVIVRASMVDNDGTPAYLRSLTNTDEEWCAGRDHSGNVIGFVITSNSLANNGWSLILDEYDDSTNTLRASVDNGTGATAGSGPTMAFNSSTEIRWGRDFEGTYGGAHKLAHMFVAKRPLTAGERTALAAGDNPIAVLGADIVDYIFDDYTDSRGGGFTYSEVGSGSSITWDAGDNPTVDDPPGGGGATDSAAPRILRPRFPLSILRL